MIDRYLNFLSINMKNNASLGLLALLLVASFMFQASLVEAAATCGTAIGIYCNPTTTPSLRDAILIVIKYLFSLIGIVCLIFIVIAGIKYTTSAGNEQRATSAKEAFSSAVLGLIIALLAYGILDIIQGILNT